MRVDLVSDIACPWCVIGLKSLEAAAARVPGVSLELHFQPFELNPDMPPEGEDIDAHLHRKFGAAPEQLEASRQALRQRGEELGFDFKPGARRRVYNTFDAHRLLHWAGEHSRAAQRALKLSLFSAYFTEGLNLSDPALLAARAEAAGLDGQRAREVLSSGAFSAQVREAQALWRSRGIEGVPALIFNERHLVQGGQPVEFFERVLRQLAAAPQTA